MIYFANWVLPIDRPPIQDGAVWVKDKKIQSLGTFSELKKKNPKAKIIDLRPAIVLPGLVNAHTHLELSSLKNRISPHAKFIDWVYALIENRNELTPTSIVHGIKESIQELDRTGTTLVGDISNTELSVPLLRKSRLDGIVFLEHLGNKIKKKRRRKSKSEKRFLERCACHGPHTVSLNVAKSIHRQNNRTSIHLCESADEVAWIKNQTGPFKDLLGQLALDPNPFLGKGLSPVEYLSKINFLNHNSLCVHAVHLLPIDLHILRKRRCHVAICIRSNLWSGAGIPPVRRLMESEIPLSLGTDSMASNLDLNLWKEMNALKKNFAFLSDAFIVRMATLNGAHALGLESSYGSLEPGKNAHFIAVKTPSKKVKHPYSYLIQEEHEKIDRIFH